MVEGSKSKMTPNFGSEHHHEILGCAENASKAELTRAYRDLSWKYHPHNRENDPEATKIFVRIGKAYACLVGNVRGDIETDACTGKWTSSDAIRAYKDNFGKSRKLYFDEGGLVGLPHACALRGEFGKSRNFLRLCVFGRIHLGLFRSWHIKMQLDRILTLVEVVLTWGSVTAFVMYILFREEYEWHINVVGGVGILLSFWLLSFWYGFTRYPVMIEKDFMACLMGADTTKRDMDEIRDVCSEYYHGDKWKRSQTVATVLSVPFLFVDQLLASLAIVLLAIFLYPLQKRLGMSPETVSFLRGIAKSTGAMLAAIAYYAAWILGGDTTKAYVLASLLANQTLYTSILCRMGFSEFLGLQLFRGILSLSISHQDDSSLPRSKDPDSAPETALGEDTVGEGMKTSKENQNASLTEDDSSGEIERAYTYGDQINGVLNSHGLKSNDTSSCNRSRFAHTDLETGPTFHSFADEGKHTTNLDEKLQLMPSGDSIFWHGGLSHSEAAESEEIEVSLSRDVMAHCHCKVDTRASSDKTIQKHELSQHGSRGTKWIDFAGDVYSPRLKEEELAEENQRSTQSAANLPYFFQLLQNRFHPTVGYSCISAFKASKFAKLMAMKKERFVRSSTLSTMTESQTTVTKLQRTEPKSIEKLTIVSDVESSLGLTRYDDPQVASAQDMVSTIDSHGDKSAVCTEPVLETISSYESRSSTGDRPQGSLLPTTAAQCGKEKEVPPPDYAVSIEKATEESILDKDYPETSEAKENGVRGGSQAETPKSQSVLEPPPPPPPLNQSILSPSTQVEIPKQIYMVGTSTSIDEEDVTVMGFDLHQPLANPARSGAVKNLDTTVGQTVQRGRRPAPGKVDLPTEALEAGHNFSLSTDRCDQFIYFESPHRL